MGEVSLATDENCCSLGKRYRPLNHLDRSPFLASIGWFPLVLEPVATFRRLGTDLASAETVLIHRSLEKEPVSFPLGRRYVGGRFETQFRMSFRSAANWD